jgi:hypothetical protein
VSRLRLDGSFAKFLLLKLKLDSSRCPSNHHIEIEPEGNCIVFLDRKPTAFIDSGNFFPDLKVL